MLQYYKIVFKESPDQIEPVSYSDSFWSSECFFSLPIVITKKKPYSVDLYVSANWLNIERVHN